MFNGYATRENLGLLFAIALLVVCTVLQKSYAENNNEACAVALMPCPFEVRLQPGEHKITLPISIYVNGMSEPRKEDALNHFDDALQGINLPALKRVDDEAVAHIVLKVVENGTNAPSLAIPEHLKETEYTAPEVNRFVHPYLGMDESYSLNLSAMNAQASDTEMSGNKKVLIQANTDFGAMHGLRSLMQLLFSANEGSYAGQYASQHAGQYAGQKEQSAAPKSLKLPLINIVDKPEFAWRGLLIDSVRHFIPLDDIKRQLRGMAAAKLNVFHWHLNDDQGWRIESKRYPKLHQLASDNLYYSQEEIKELVQYASLLGIRVVPEFDIPGHASAIAVAYPELMADKKQSEMQRHWGVFEPVLDVSDDRVYSFVDAIVKEFSRLFPDAYLHIGGDEVNPTQWLNNPNIRQLMLDYKLHSSEDIHHYFNVKVQNILAKYQRKLVGWDEIYHPDLPQDIVIQSWRGLDSITEFTQKGYQGVLSTGFYIDQPQYSAYHYRNAPIRDLYSHDVSKCMDIGEKISSRAWALEIERLKGSPVTGVLRLEPFTQDNTPVKVCGYMQLNERSFRQVDIRSLTQQEKRSSALSGVLKFSVDSWMGPLNIEMNVGETASLLQAHRLFIGNAFYMLNAQELVLEEMPDIKLPAALTDDKRRYVLGGEATLWSELVTHENIDIRTWPRLFVIAERLWSPPTLTDSDNMYERLFVIDQYARDVVGLQHYQQQTKGFSKLLGATHPALDTTFGSKSKTQTNSVNDIDRNEPYRGKTSSLIASLRQLAPLFEPAHYYTRHHIKYRQNKYHQLAPLDDFVDYLGPESLTLIELTQALQAQETSKSSVIEAISKQLALWQQSILNLQDIDTNTPELARFKVLLNEASAFLRLAHQTIDLCSGTSTMSNAQVTSLQTQLMALQAQQKETLIAAVPLFLTLIEACHTTSSTLPVYRSVDWVADGVFTNGVEGPAVGKDGALYAVNFQQNGTIGRVSGQHQAVEFARLPNDSIGNGIDFDLAGNMYIADYVNHNVMIISAENMRREGGVEVEVYAHFEKMNQPNDIVVSSSGLIFASDPNWAQSNGNLWRINKDRTVTLLEGNMGTTNGIALSPDEKTLYVNESVQRKVWQYKLDKDGNVISKSLLISFDDFGLDGMLTDASGNIYIARYSKGVIAIVSPQGKILREVALKGKYPTNVALGGNNKKRMFVTMQKRGAIESFLIE
ncbi:family 20 glycosylhydrolase [Glaciecola siphonariae]|uniref:Family 20 glycosylhydrolase n=1 Tax=Glaciecola siphonariae TaxID=521012 RepID=A0ABV9LZE3_9ALTE